MKKLFSMVAVILLAIGLTACTSDDLASEIADLEAQIETLEQEKAILETNLEDADGLLDEIEQLEQELQELYELVDVVVTVSITDLDGVEVSKTYSFSEATKPSLKDLLVLAYDANIMDSEYGSYLAGFPSVDVPYGSYIAISENDEMAMVGIDDLVIDNEDVFDFDVMWWDTTQQAVYESIMLFVDNQVGNYISASNIDYNVLLACQNVCDLSVTDAEIETYIDGLDLVTVQDYFKAIMIANTLSDTTTSDALLADFVGVAATGLYGQTALGLIALNSRDHGLDFSAYETNALTYYDASTPYDEGLDAGGMALVGLSDYANDTEVQALIDQYVNWLVAEQLPSGGVKTRDLEWNGTVYPGAENAASMAQAILGLVANGIDPASGDFVEGDNNLVLRLTEFQLADGSFDWDLTDDIANDPYFSTPQAFLALVTYYQFMNTYGSETNLYTN